MLWLVILIGRFMVRSNSRMLIGLLGIVGNRYNGESNFSKIQAKKYGQSSVALKLNFKE